MNVPASPSLGTGQRTRPRGIVLTFLLLAAMSFTLLGPARPAWACSCAQQTDAEHFEGATQVFIGAPILINDADPVLWEFTVESVQKGPVSEIQRVAIPRHQVEDCWFNFSPGRRYQVFGGERDGVVFTGICSGTRDLTSGLAAYLPTEPTPPITEQEPPPTSLPSPSEEPTPGETTIPPAGPEEPTEPPTPTAGPVSDAPPEPVAQETTSPVAEAASPGASDNALTIVAVLAAILAVALLTGRSIRRQL